MTKRILRQHNTLNEGVTVSIVSHLQAEMVAPLLEDLQRLSNENVKKIVITQNLPEDSPYLKVATGARDAIALVLRKNTAPCGFATNHNNAFADCETRYFAVLNPDLRLIDNPFPSLQAAIGRINVGLACPQLLNSDMTLQDSARDLITPASLIRRKLLGSSESQVEWVSGAFMFFDTKAFSDLGGFDEKFRLYCEDTDICLRLRLMGRSFLLLTDARVLHQAQRATKTSIKHLIWHLGSLFRLWTSPTFWRYLRRRDELRQSPHA